jgi:hypothetical protein
LYQADKKEENKKTKGSSFFLHKLFKIKKATFEIIAISPDFPHTTTGF